MADPVDLPFDEPLDAEHLASVLSRRLNDARESCSSSSPGSPPSDALVVTREPTDGEELHMRFTLLPTDPGAGPLSLLTAGDEVEISMGVAGAIHVFGRGDEVAGENVRGPIQTYIRAVVEGGLREAYWPETFTGPPFRMQSKTHLRVDGKWRRVGAVGVARRGTGIERQYEPYA